MTNSEILTKEDKKIRDEAVARLMGTMFYKWVAMKDGNTCTECTRQHGRVFHIKEIKGIRAYIKPPCHSLCRCTLVPYKDFYEK